MVESISLHSINIGEGATGIGKLPRALEEFLKHILTPHVLALSIMAVIRETAPSLLVRELLRLRLASMELLPLEWYAFRPRWQ